MSYTMDATQLKIGAAKIWADNGSGPRAIGYTLDDININFGSTFHDSKTAQLGDMIVGKRLTGQNADIEFSMLETSKNNLILSLPMSTVFTGGGGGQSLGIGDDPYGSLLDHCAKMRIHPINQKGTGGVDDETYLDDDVTFWKCANSDPLALPLKSGEDRSYKIKLTAFPDTTKPSGMYLGIIGDPSNTTVDVTPPALNDTAALGVNVLKSAVRTRILSGTALAACDAATDIQVVMNEALDSGSALNKGTYILNDDATPDVPITITTLAYNSTTFTVTLTIPACTSAHTYRLGIAGLKDLGGNFQIIPIIRRFTIS